MGAARPLGGVTVRQGPVPPGNHVGPVPVMSGISAPDLASVMDAAESGDKTGTMVNGVRKTDTVRLDDLARWEVYVCFERCAFEAGSPGEDLKG